MPVLDTPWTNFDERYPTYDQIVQPQSPRGHSRQTICDKLDKPSHFRLLRPQPCYDRTTDSDTTAPGNMWEWSARGSGQRFYLGKIKQNNSNAMIVIEAHYGTAYLAWVPHWPVFAITLLVGQGKKSHWCPIITAYLAWVPYLRSKQPVLGTFIPTCPKKVIQQLHGKAIPH